MVKRGNLQIAEQLDALVADEIAPGTGVDVAAFWTGFQGILDDLVPQNQALLARRDELQAAIDAWHLARKGQLLDPAEYKSFLVEIGYLVPEPGDFKISQPSPPRVARIIDGSL